MINCAQGGRGHGLTVPQKKLLDMISARYGEGWEPELAIVTRRKPPYPVYYGVDIACKNLRICIEVDGPSHRHPAVKKSDVRKERFLRGEGWCVIRVTNDQVYHCADIPVSIKRQITRRIREWAEKSQQLLVDSMDQREKASS